MCVRDFSDRKSILLLLAEKIANELLVPSVMRRRIAALSPECRALLERAMKGLFVPMSEEIEDAQCLAFGEAFYGVFDKDVLRAMFNVRKGFHISEEELEKLCNEFPADMTECHLEEGQSFIVAEYLAYDDSYKDLLDIQAGKEFYIPNEQEILDYVKNLYLSQEPAYQNFREFLQHEIGMTYEDADDVALEFELGKCRFHNLAAYISTMEMII